MKLINICETPNWKHHRYGWNWVIEGLQSMHSKDGIDFYDWCDGVFRDQRILQKPWFGIIHNVIKYPNPNPFHCRILDLENLVKFPCFIESMKNCIGLWTLTKITSNFLKNKLHRQVKSIYHPANYSKITYDHNRFLNSPKVVMIGQWMRKYKSFLELDIDIPKFILAPENKSINEMLSEIHVIHYLKPEQYDLLLGSSLVFLDFYDVAACNTVLECIMSSTPMLVRRMPAIEEYLGINYPLFYENISEACFLCQNKKKILKSHIYLKSMDKSNFERTCFVNSITKDILSFLNN